MDFRAARTGLAKVSIHAALNALHLPPTARQQLLDFCVQHSSAHSAAASRLLILSGANPGTGKTMAAEVIASALNLRLYRVDLAKVLNKYIGETEKNLDKLFANAENSNSLLFFDEADALFGKRTDVKDSHDRYANLDVNYLLQKIEQYRGLVVLASNRWPPPHARPIRKIAVVIR